ncbi:hypothetical protein COU53_03730 [Candidatus Pacearchaeota archaeon CG10_big_fil_rev_8_21_14_0_10_30_48]|nr:MAG: hypothetical protein COU53_03730 [Candidatus Pacearchaeota archaeon CG10_big_fil_rev_8_21_14_0_10_30_48]
MVKKSSKKVNSKPKKTIIYSKIPYEEAISTKRGILEVETSLLEIMQNIKSYRELRRKELMWKIKLKRNLGEIKEEISNILQEVPRTAGIKEIEREHHEKNQKHKSPIGMNIEVELAEIQKKLEEMNKSQE